MFAHTRYTTMLVDHSENIGMLISFVQISVLFNKPIYVYALNKLCFFDSEN